MIDKLKEKVIDKREVDKLYEMIAPLIMHHCWVSFQMGACQEYNIRPKKYQLDSLRNAMEMHKRHPNVTARKMHENWIKFKKSQGWVYGSVKDDKKKTHPDLVPWDLLMEVEQEKDTMHIESKKFAKKLAKRVSNFYYDEIKNYLRAFEDD